MNPSMEIFSQGEEIVTGQVVDTNAAWLSQQAVAMGFTVTRHTAVGDKLDDLIKLLQDISTRADCCICTGGLGPTSDDLTAEAVAKAFDLPLEFDEIAFTQIQQFFSSRSRAMPECNRKQAMLPKSSIRLDNAIGTAPGFALQQGRCWFAFVPGVPSEMRHLFLEHIQAMLAAKFELHPSRLITIKTVGIGESGLQERINKIQIPPQVQLGFRADIGEVQTKLLFPNDYPQAKLSDLTELVSTAIGDAVYAIDGLGHQSGDLVSVIDQLMTTKNQTLAVVETISHGLLAAKLVGVYWLLNATYEQAIEKLTQRLEVNYYPDDLAETAKAISRAVQKNTDASIVLIQLTGDQVANQDKPQTISTVLFVSDEFKVTTRNLVGDIKRKQQQAVISSLDLLRGYLQGKEIVS
jgi:competence/damage-inducible protein CinA-like protein